MNENLIKREEERLSGIESKKREKESNKIASEDSDYIMKEINDLKTQIETKLDVLDTIEAKDELEIRLKELSCDYERLHQFINESVLYLAKYNIKLCQTLLNSIRSQIDTKKDSLVPKSKFSFKSSIKRNVKNSDPIDSQLSSVDQIDSSGSQLPSVQFIGFKNMSDCDQTLRMSSEECNSKDLQLEDLTNCRIEIFGAPNTLKINGLVNCSVFCGPITTSIFLSNCKDCVFKIAAQQLRIHSSYECKVYLHVTSRAIIEDSTQISFGPYDWTYEHILQDFKTANLDINCNNWRLIDDFDCLVTDKPSNNWSFIE